MIYHGMNVYRRDKAWYWSIQNTELVFGPFATEGEVYDAIDRWFERH